MNAAVDAERAAVAELQAFSSKDDDRMRAAIEAERAVSHGLREQAGTTDAALQTLQQQATEWRAAHDRLAQALEDERRTRGELERRCADLEQTHAEQGRAHSGVVSQLEHTKHDASAQVERARLEASHQMEALKESHQTALSHAQAEAQVLLDRARSDAESRLERERLAAQATLEAERESVAELRKALDQARHQLSVLVDAKAETQMGAAETQEALAHSRNEIRTLRDELEASRTRIEKLAGEQADTERSLKRAESQLKLVTRERDALIEQPPAAAAPAPAPARPTTVEAKTAPAETPARGKKATDKGAEKSVDKADRSADMSAVEKAAQAADTEWAAIRMSPRYSFNEPIDVQINGGVSTLVDLSVGGCQVLSATSLKPNQSVKVAIPHEPKAIACSGKVVWAKLEAPSKGRPSGYRAGVEFSKADQATIEAFIIKHGALR